MLRQNFLRCTVQGTDQEVWKDIFGGIAIFIAEVDTAL